MTKQTNKQNKNAVAIPSGGFTIENVGAILEKLQAQKEALLGVDPEDGTIASGEINGVDIKNCEKIDELVLALSAVKLSEREYTKTLKAIKDSDKRAATVKCPAYKHNKFGIPAWEKAVTRRIIEISTKDQLAFIDKNIARFKEYVSKEEQFKMDSANLMKELANLAN